jgi:hypothetical protein
MEATVTDGRQRTEVDGALLQTVQLVEATLVGQVADEMVDILRRLVLLATGIDERLGPGLPIGKNDGMVSIKVARDIKASLSFFSSHYLEKLLCTLRMRSLLLMAKPRI